MAGEKNGKLLREMHSDIQVLISEVGAMKEHIEHQNSHIDELMRFKIGIRASLATLGAVSMGSLAIAGLAVTIAQGWLS